MDKNLIQFDETDFDLIFDNVSSASRDGADVLEQEGCAATADFHPETVTGNNENDEELLEDATHYPNLGRITRYTSGNPPERFGYDRTSIAVDPNKTRERLQTTY